MILKRRFFRIMLKTLRIGFEIADSVHVVNKSICRSIARIAALNWKKFIRLMLKIVALGTTAAGAMTAASTGSSVTSIAMGTAGAAASAVALKGVPVKGYDKIKHVSPATGNRAAGHDLLGRRGSTVGSNMRMGGVKMPTGGRR